MAASSNILRALALAAGASLASAWTAYLTLSTSQQAVCSDPNAISYQVFASADAPCYVGAADPSDPSTVFSVSFTCSSSGLSLTYMPGSSNCQPVNNIQFPITNVPFATTAGTPGTCTASSANPAFGAKAVSTSCSSDDGKEIAFFVSATCTGAGGRALISRRAGACTQYSPAVYFKTTGCGDSASVTVHLGNDPTCAAEGVPATLSSSGSCAAIFPAGTPGIPDGAGATMSGKCDPAYTSGASSTTVSGVATAAAVAAVAAVAAGAALF